jgi:YgiT-type zinc finger domain-containing protein
MEVKWKLAICVKEQWNYLLWISKLGGIVVKDMPAEVCSRCNEKYFDTRTASFIQEIAGCLAEKRKEYLIDKFKTAYEVKGAA